MGDWAYVNGMAEEYGGDDEIHDPQGHLGATFGTVAGARLTTRRTSTAYGPPLKCRQCGDTDVKWRAENGGWRLYDKKREHPGNRMVPHVCPQPDNTTDGFEDC